jgi:hypothetical protein
MTIETSAMTSPTLFHLNEYLVIALIAHAEDLLVFFTYVASLRPSLLSSLLWRGIGVIGSSLTVTTSSSTVDAFDYSPSSAGDLLALDVPVIWTSFDLVWHLGYHLSLT